MKHHLGKSLQQLHCYCSNKLQQLQEAAAAESHATVELHLQQLAATVAMLLHLWKLTATFVLLLQQLSATVATMLQLQNLTATVALQQQQLAATVAM